MNVQCSGGSRSLAKEKMALKMKSAVDGHWKLTMTNWEPSPKLVLFQLHKKLPKNSTSTIIWPLGIWSKLERWKSWISGCLMSWLRIKKSSFLKCSVLLFYITMNHFSDCDVWWKVDFIMADVQLSGWTKKLQSTFENQTWTKKRSWSLFGGLLPTTTAFWIPAKPLHLRSTLSKSMRCTENRNAHSWYWSTQRAQFFSMTRPDHHIAQPVSKV